MRQVITYRQAKKIKERFEKGETAIDLAQEYGVGRGTIYYSIKRANSPCKEQDLFYPLSISLPSSVAEKLRLKAKAKDKFVSVVVRELLASYLSSSKKALPSKKSEEKNYSSISVKLGKELYDDFTKEARKRGKRLSVLGRDILLSYLM